MKKELYKQVMDLIINHMEKTGNEYEIVQIRFNGNHVQYEILEQYKCNRNSSTMCKIKQHHYELDATFYNGQLEFED